MMTAEKTQVEITGTFFNRLYRSDDASYCVCLYTDMETQNTFAAVGNNLPEADFPVKFLGTWTTSAKYGCQFVVDMVLERLPHDPTDIVQYISSLRLGIGKARAEEMVKLVDSAGNFWDEFQADPMQFQSVKGITPKALYLLQKEITKQSAQKQLNQLFCGHLTLDASHYNKICSFFHNDLQKMIAAIQENPFVLMECGYKFEELDYFSARHTAYAVNDSRRLTAAAQQCLLNAKANAHVCLPFPVLAQEMAKLLNKEGPVPLEELEAFLRYADSLILSNGSVYLPRAYKEETLIANTIAQLVSSQDTAKVDLKKYQEILTEYSSQKGFTLSSDQSNAVYTALTSRFCIITGGPGTGKSTILDALLVCWKEFYDDNWLLMAPTGKAAVRISETTSQPATTIHSGLGLAIGSEDLKNIDDDVASAKASLIVVDEASMLDQTIMTSLLLSLKDNDTELPQHLVLVGDPDQLPSVGWGNILADMISSNVLPVCNLQTIYRQGKDSPIITNSLKMKAGDQDLDFSSRSFVRYHCGTDDINMKKAASFYQRCVACYGIDKVVLLSPYHNTSEISTRKLNNVLQATINPDHGQPYVMTKRQILRLGDRVMQLKNTTSVSNGDVGSIIKVNPSASASDPCVVVKFENGTTIDYISEDLPQLELAYAISIHKSQGSQYPVVIIVMPNRFTRFLKRNLLYTAITRSSQNVAIFSPSSTLKKCIVNSKPDERYTNLSNRLRAELNRKGEQNAES